jgi:hypothetical protein
MIDWSATSASNTLLALGHQLRPSFCAAPRIAGVAQFNHAFALLKHHSLRVSRARSTPC